MDGLVSMSFSIFSMLSNSKALLKTTAAKQMNIEIVPDVAEMLSIYSIKSLAT